MGQVDLEIVSRLYEQAKEWDRRHSPPSAEIDYLTVLSVSQALLSNKALAQEFVDETWEKDQDEILS